jgi:hypothetical protein
VSPPDLANPDEVVDERGQRHLERGQVRRRPPSLLPRGEARVHVDPLEHLPLQEGFARLGFGPRLVGEVEPASPGLADDNPVGAAITPPDHCHRDHVREHHSASSLPRPRVSARRRTASSAGVRRRRRLIQESNSEVRT